MHKTTCAAYIAFFVGLSWGRVGELPTATEPYTWQLPFSLATMLIVPALLGYFAGREES